MIDTQAIFECHLCVNTGKVAHVFNTLGDLNRHKRLMHHVQEDLAKAISFSLRPSDIKKLDAKRGNNSRSEYIKKLINEP